MTASIVIATLRPVAQTEIIVTWHKCLADAGGIMSASGWQSEGYTVIERTGLDKDVVRYKSTRLHRSLNRAIKLHIQLHESSLVVSKDAAAGVLTPRYIQIFGRGHRLPPT